MRRLFNAVLSACGHDVRYSRIATRGQSAFAACRHVRDGWQDQAQDFVTRANRAFTLSGRRRQLLGWAVATLEECLNHRDEPELVRSLGYSLHNFADCYDGVDRFDPARFSARPLAAHWPVLSLGYKSAVLEMACLTEDELLTDAERSRSSAG